MKSLRLALVSPRFWPLTGEPERHLARLGEEFRAQGARPIVVTARWGSQWPGQVVHREVPTIRIGVAPQGGWNTLRFVRELARWLRKEHQNLDAVLVTNLRFEAYTCVGAMRHTSIPVVLMPDEGRTQSDCQWQNNASLGRRVQKRCQLADKIVVAHRSQCEELLASNYRPDLIEEIPSAAIPTEPRTNAKRFEARLALAAVNHDLAIEQYAPLALVVDRLTRNRGLVELINAWQTVGERWPMARLWIIGDGPARDELYERINDHGLRSQILLPGSFDDLNELFQAADVFVSPSVDTPPSPALFSAMAAGLPIVASRTPDHQARMEDGRQAVLVPEATRSSIAAALMHLFEAREQATQLGIGAQQHAASRYALPDISRQFLELFSRLQARRLPQ